MSLTTDPDDPRLVKGVDDTRRPQNDVYLVLSDEEIAKGFVRPLRQTYKHLICGVVTHMGLALSQTYARDPTFYGSTYCTQCGMHRPVSEFVWEGTNEAVGS